jgi:hypothetical protein
MERRARGGRDQWAGIGFKRKRPILAHTDTDTEPGTGGCAEGEGEGEGRNPYTDTVSGQDQGDHFALGKRKARERVRLDSDDSSDEASTPSPNPRFTMERIIEEKETGEGEGVGVGVGVDRRDTLTAKPVGKEHDRPVEAEAEGDQDIQSSRPSKRRTQIKRKRENGPPRWKREAKRLSRRTSTAFLGADA